MGMKTLKDYLDSFTSLGELRPRIFVHGSLEGDFLLYHFYEENGCMLYIHDGYQIRRVELLEYVDDKETDNYRFAKMAIGMQKDIDAFKNLDVETVESLTIDLEDD